MNQYDISTLDAAPAMTHSKVAFDGTFEDAIKAAHASFEATGRTTSIFSRGGSTYWYRIAADGSVINVNLRMPLPPVNICEHCGKPVTTTEEHIMMERHSGPSTHYLFFHKECWRCPKCGTNGPHYCPADIATE
jgi:hypothetical protein